MQKPPSILPSSGGNAVIAVQCLRADPYLSSCLCREVQEQEGRVLHQMSASTIKVFLCVWSCRCCAPVSVNIIELAKTTKGFLVHVLVNSHLNLNTQCFSRGTQCLCPLHCCVVWLFVFSISCAQHVLFTPRLCLDQTCHHFFQFLLWSKSNCIWFVCLKFCCFISPYAHINKESLFF